MTIEQESMEDLARRLRITQLSALVAGVGLFALHIATHPGGPAPTVRVQRDEVSIEVPEHATRAALRASALDAFVSLEAPGTFASLHVSPESHVVRLTAEGRFLTELRFDTDTGSVYVVRNADQYRDPAMEVVTQLVGPLEPEPQTPRNSP